MWVPYAVYDVSMILKKDILGMLAETQVIVLCLSWSIKNTNGQTYR